MEHHTILYIFAPTTRSNSVLAAIKATGCEVVGTNSPTEGVALLYILGQVAAVVLDSRIREHASFDVVQSLRRIRPSVPVMLECSDRIDGSSLSTDACVSTDQLVFALQHLLAAESVA
jgi:DNA-binding NarL/FixJ family response regulator